MMRRYGNMTDFIDICIETRSLFNMIRSIESISVVG